MQNNIQRLNFTANHQEQYNIPYLKFLKEIYTIQNDEVNLANTLKELFPRTFDFNDYLFITSRMDPEEKKKWRTKVLSRARNASRNYNDGALTFCFELMNHEASYRKMIEYIDSSTPYAIIVKYFEVMVAADKSRLLEAILRRSDFGLFFRSDKIREDESFLPVLFDLIKKFYSSDYLKTLITQFEKGRTFFYRSNIFIEYIKQRLQE